MKIRLQNIVLKCLTLAALLLVAVDGWGQEYTSTFTASLGALRGNNGTATGTYASWTENNVTFTLSPSPSSGGNLTLAYDDDSKRSYFQLSPNSTYELRWAVNNDANVFNVVSEAKATTRTIRSAGKKDGPFVYGTSEEWASGQFKNYSSPAEHDFVINGDGLDGDGYITFTTSSASESYGIWPVYGTDNFKYCLYEIKLTYSLFRKFHYAAYVITKKADGTSASSDYGVAYASFTNTDASYTSSSVSGNVEATSTDQTSASVTAYFRAVPNTANGKVFMGWKRNPGDENYLFTSTDYSTSIETTSQDHEHPAQLTLYAIFGDKFERVVKYQNTDATSATIHVGDVLDNAFTISECGADNTLSDISDDNFYYTIANTPSSSTKEGCASGHENDVITFDPSTKTITAWNAGEATITFYQKETDYILSNGVNGKSFTIIVEKLANPISINGNQNTYSASINYADVTDDLTFSSPNNSREGRPAYVVEQTAGSTIATYTETGSRKYISSTYNKGTATWSVTQAEDYKYNEGTATITVNVVPMVEEECYLVNTTGEDSCEPSDFSPRTWEDSLDVAGTLTFYARQSSSVEISPSVTPIQKIGNDWITMASVGDASLTDKYPSSPFSREMTPSAKGIKFSETGTLNRYIHTIKVTRLTFLRIKDNIPSIDMGNILPTKSVSKDFYVEWSSSNAGDIHITSNDSHFTVSPSIISNTDCKSGRTKVTITYSSADAGEHSATITVYNKALKTSVAVSGKAAKHELLIHGNSIGGDGQYLVEDELTPFSFEYNKNATPVAAPTEGENSSHFYYTISHTLPDNAIVIGGEEAYKDKVATYSSGTLKARNAGTAVITFVETGNDTIQPTSASYTITVNKHTPVFTWNEGNEDAGLYFNHNSYHNNRYVDVVVTNSTHHNTGCALTILSSSNDTVAILETGTTPNAATLSTHNYYSYKPLSWAKSTELSITQSENYYWAEGRFSRTFTPLKSNRHVPFTYGQTLYEDDGFTSKSAGATVDQKDDYVNYLIHGSKKNDHSLILHFEGIPDSLSFQYKARTTTGAAQWEDSHFYVYQSDDGSNWFENPWHRKYNDASSYVQEKLKLNPATRYLKFVYHGGSNGGYFGNIQVTELRQFEVDPPLLNFGTARIGSNPKKDFYFKHANAGYDTKVSVDNTGHNVNGQTYKALNGNIIVRLKDGASSVTSITGTGGDTINQAYLEVEFSAIEDGVYGGYIYITDLIGDTAKVWVTGERVSAVPAPVFTWNPNNQRYFAGTSIPNILSSTNSSGAITYTSDKPEVAEVIIDGTLIIYKAGETVHITAVQEAITDQWARQSQTYEVVTLQKSDFNVPLALDKTIYDGSQLYSNNGYDWDTNKDEGAGVRFGPSGYGGIFNWDDKYIVIYFNGTPDSLFFDYRTNHVESSWADWIVAESVTGAEDSWHDIWSDTYNGSSSLRHAAVGLSKSTQYVRIMYTGNYCGYIRNVYITSLEGVEYVRQSGTHLYVSRGGAENHQAVMDEYGLAIRHARMTKNNTDTLDLFQFVDNYRYLTNATTTIDTWGKSNPNTTSAQQWVSTQENDSCYTLQNDGKYIGVDMDDSTLVMVNQKNDAARFVIERPATHRAWLNNLLEIQALDAASEFKVGVANRAELANRLTTNDYVRTTNDNISPKHTYPLAENATKERFEQAGDGSKGAIDGMSGTITVEPGLYRLSLKAFYRETFNDSAYSYYAQNIDNSVAYVVANGKKTPIMSVYSSSRNEPVATEEWPDFEMEDVFYPNGVAAAAEAFGMNPVNGSRYDNEIFLYVEDEGDGTGVLSYGLYAPSNGGVGNWFCYDEGYTLTKYTRREYVFNNSSGNGLWNDPDNWDGDKGDYALPLIVHNVTLQAPVTVDTTSAAAHTIDYGNNVSSITINADAGLTVGEGGFKGTPAKPIVIKADNTNALTKGQTGSLKLYPGLTAPQAVVQFYSTISNEPENTDWDWQYIGSPITQESSVNNEQIFYNCWLYQHDTESDSWTTAGNWNKMEPFRAYAFTRNSGKPSQYGRPSTGPMFLYSGQLNAPVPDTIVLKYRDATHAENHIANSWTAPIDLRNFEKEDFVNAEPTIYIYTIAGKGNVESKAIFTIKYTGDSVLSSMQGFFVKATSAESPKLILDYERLIWNGRTVNAPLKAPSRLGRNGEETDLTARVCVHLLSADSIPDRIFLLEKEGEGFSRSYTEGYDAPKYMVDGLPCIYTYETSGPHLAVNATDSLLGTYLAINTNASQTYTLSFDKVVGEGLGLRDLVTDTVVPIADGVQYTFTAVPNQKHQLRFVVDEYIAPEIGQGGTGLEQVGGSILIRQDGQILSVTGAPANASLRIYDAAGKLVWNEAFHYAIAIDMSVLPSGVYVATVDNAKLKVLR